MRFPQPVFLFVLLLALFGCQDVANDSQSSPSSDAETADDAGSPETGAEQAQTDSSDDFDSGILAPGSPAPEINLTSVVHGPAFESLQEDRVYVIEFWATWCGPCLQSMPHISELQDQYKGQVQFVGVSDEDTETVTEFLSGTADSSQTWAEILRYTIAIDEDGTTQRDYMLAAQQQGIPCAFIVNKGKQVAWIGHPMDIEEPLQAVVDGNWDISDARSDFLSTVTPADPPPRPVADIDPLAPGMEAPAVSLGDVLHGPAFGSFQSGKVYVVEFWATWCGPCLQSMPHISALQKEYGDAVQFIGVTDEDAETVNGFLQQTSPQGETWADVLSYSIALDDDSSTSRDYMMASGQGGIPCAFIVDQAGKVAWIGHPMEIDTPLENVVSGSFDIAAAAKRFEVEKQLQPALRQGDFDKALQVLDELLETEPKNLQHGMIKMQILGLMSKHDEMLAFTSDLLKTHDKDDRLQHAVARVLTTQPDLPASALDLALQAAVAAQELTGGQNGAVLETLAGIYHAKGYLTQAVEWQTKAAELVPESEDLQEVLNEYKAELAAQQSASEPPADGESAATPDESEQGESETDPTTEEGESSAEE